LKLRLTPAVTVRNIFFEHDLKPNEQIKGKTTNMKTYLLSILICCAIITAAFAAALDTAKIDQTPGSRER
jgi:hypothetical protein